MEIGSSIYHTQFTPQLCTPTHLFTVNSSIATIIQEMEWCDVCRGHYVQWALVSQLEPNARRSRALQDYADVVTKHVCTNRICSQRWYECDHSCRKNNTRHTRFSHPYILGRHMNRYHNNSNKNTVPTCSNVTMEEEPVDDTCMQ
jgi:hypothetical protein